MKTYEETDSRQSLVDSVLAQICRDVNNGDLTAIEELVKNLSDEQLRGFLSEIE